MPRQPLSADRIATEALALMDAEGHEAFSFRVLGARLGCQAMSLYHYFPSKEALFQTLADRLLTEAGDFPDEGLWQERLRLAARAYLGMAQAHPGFYPWFALQPLRSAAGLRLSERQMAIFAAAGLPPKQRVRRFRAFGYFLLGACLEMTTSGGAEMTYPPETCPTLAEVADLLGAEKAELAFEAALDLQIRGLEAVLKR